MLSRASHPSSPLLRLSSRRFENRAVLIPSAQLSSSSFCTTSPAMAPPKAALDFVDFVNASPTPYHATKSAAERFEKAGFTLIKERDSWASKLQPGGKYYLTRNGSSIVAFAIGRKWRPGNPVAIVGAHTDSPCLRVKPIGVETYGGGIWHSWFDRDLSIAGRVLVRDGDSFVQRLVKVDRPLLRIPTLAIHLHRQSNFDPNKETELTAAKPDEDKKEEKKDDDDDEDFRPLDQMSERHHPGVLDVLASELEVDVSAIADFELVLYDTQKSCIAHLLPRLDNLGMTYCSVMGLISSVRDGASLDNDSTIRMTVCFDHEEIGSQSAQGAHSNLLPSVIRRLSVLPGNRDASSEGSYEAVHHEGEESTAYEQTLSRSFLVSADMAHAVHPNYAGKYEPSHQPAMNKGTVIKINANQRYATNSPGIVLVQDTIGPGLAAKLGMRTLDLGNPQLSMHSIRETGGTADVEHAVKLFDQFFESYGRLEPKILVD
ncbi:hypothetical protein ACCO45_001826 [Purpureocillium lilacinum]|uniref:Uncharacterized protein n=1 Tax=Purpureocillium lilacinum TaxID=33203 RepID=A0ACC4E873_PURLI